MKIEVTFIPSEYRLLYGYHEVGGNAPDTHGLQLDPLKTGDNQ